MFVAILSFFCYNPVAFPKTPQRLRPDGAWPDAPNTVRD